MSSPPLALPFTLYPSKGKQLGWGVLSAAFVVIGVLMIRDGQAKGWFVTGVFGVCLVAFLAQLLPGSSSFSADTEGIEFTVTFRKKRFAWREIEDFGVFTLRNHGVPVSRMVGFNLVPEARTSPKARAVAKALSGFEAALPDTYGYKAEELAELLAGHHRDWAPRGGVR